MKPDLGAATPGADGGTIPVSNSVLTGLLAVSLLANVAMASWYFMGGPKLAAGATSPPDQRVVRSELARWISDARDVVTDSIDEKVKIDDVYGMVQGASAARNYLDAWYPAAGRSPFERGKNESVIASVDTILPIDAKTYAVDWTETIRDLKGNTTGTQQWKATIGIAFLAPAAEATLERNPLGMYVTDLAWAQAK